MQLKRVTIYLSYVAFVFLLVSALYQLKVAPTFLASYEVFELSIPSHILLYRDFWLLFTFVVIVLLIIAIKTGYELKRLYKFSSLSLNSFVFKYLTLPGIKASYLNILETVFYPMADHSDESGVPNFVITQHLRSMERSGMNVSNEMQCIIRKEGHMLALLCERQMRLISVVIAVAIIAAIFFFLVSAYSPIFILGETL